MCINNHCFFQASWKYWRRYVQCSCGSCAFVVSAEELWPFIQQLESIHPQLTATEQPWQTFRSSNHGWLENHLKLAIDGK